MGRYSLIALLLFGCSDDSPALCGGVECPNGTVCVDEVCATPCNSNADCSGTESSCVRGGCFAPACGNGVAEIGEICDGNCPLGCDDGNACTVDIRAGSAAGCDVTCSYAPIGGGCLDDDHCCPAGCDVDTDNDCSPTCGDGVLDPQESCDGDCPAGCDDGVACTIDIATGSADTCSLRCTHAAVTTCVAGDGCCPGACTVENDADCSVACGDGVLDPGETCDSDCPLVCSDSSNCTEDVLTGSAANCSASCTYPRITGCIHGDGCCPDSCTDATDNDCLPPVCVDADGDGVGDGTDGNVACVTPWVDSNDSEAGVCADSDGDGCDDCSGGSFDPGADGADADGDGTCDAGDGCVDADGDGLGVGSVSGCIDSTPDSNDGDRFHCADTDSDGCDDCAFGSWDPFDDGPDPNGDGICNPTATCVDADGDGLGDGTGGNAGCVDLTVDAEPENGTVCADTDGDGCDDCWGGYFDPDMDGPDFDGDGMCATGDCDDQLATCRSDCTADTDSDGTADCIEVFCGSSFIDDQSECLLANDAAQLEAAIDDANGASGRQYILVGDVTTAGERFTNIHEAATLRSRPGTAVTVVDDGIDRLFHLGGDNIRFSVNIVGMATSPETVIRVTGDNNTMESMTITGYYRRGISLEGVIGTVVRDVRISEGTAPEGTETAAILVAGGSSTTIADTLVHGVNSDAIEVTGTTGLLLDNNTIADNVGGAFFFYSTGSSGICARNNVLVRNDQAVYCANGCVFDQTAACTTPLGAAQSYQNVTWQNGAVCNGGACASCSCLPANWRDDADPRFAAIGAASNAYCIQEATLIDAAVDLGYDLNGAQPGNFNGAGPDIGAREVGAAPCD